MQAGIFTYEDIDDDVGSLFSSINGLDLTNNPCSFGILFRVLVGTVTISNLNYSSVNQSNNHMIIGAPTANVENTKAFILEMANTIDSSTDSPIIDIERIRKVFSGPLASINSDRIFNQLLHELSMFFILSDISPVAAFCFLYRSLESISYCLPLLYVTCTRDFHRSFTSLRDLFSGVKEREGEKKFFETFLDKIMHDDDNVDVMLEMNIEGQGASDFLKCIKEIKEQELNNTSLTVDVDNYSMSMQYRDIITYSIVIRNRFFHALQGGRNNFRSHLFDPSMIFSQLNYPLVNMISYIFSKLVEILIN